MDPKSTAVVLIEYQNDFTSNGGTLHEAVKPVMDKTNMLANTVETMKQARALGATIVYAPITFTDDYHELSPSPYGILKGVVDSKSFRQGTWGAEIVDVLKPAPGDIVVEGKRGLCGFATTNLDFILRSRGISTIALGGFLTNCCVEFDDAHRLRERLRRHHAQGLHRGVERRRTARGRREKLSDVLEADDARRVSVESQGRKSRRNEVSRLRSRLIRSRAPGRRSVFGTNRPTCLDAGGAEIMVRLNEVRRNELAVEPPASFDAGLVFVGIIRTPWRSRLDCPRQGRRDGPICRIEILRAVGRSAGRHRCVRADRSALLAARVPPRPRSSKSGERRRDARHVFAAVAGSTEPDRNGARRSGCARRADPERQGLDCLDGTPLIDLKPDRCQFTPLAPPQPGDFETG